MFPPQSSPYFGRAQLNPPPKLRKQTLAATNKVPSQTVATQANTLPTLPKTNATPRTVKRSGHSASEKKKPIATQSNSKSTTISTKTSSSGLNRQRPGAALTPISGNDRTLPAPAVSTVRKRAASPTSHLDEPPKKRPRKLVDRSQFPVASLPTFPPQEPASRPLGRNANNATGGSISANPFKQNPSLPSQKGTRKQPRKLVERSKAKTLDALPHRTSDSPASFSSLNPNSQTASPTSASSSIHHKRPASPSFEEEPTKQGRPKKRPRKLLLNSQSLSEVPKSHPQQKVRPRTLSQRERHIRYFHEQARLGRLSQAELQEKIKTAHSPRRAIAMKKPNTLAQTRKLRAAGVPIQSIFLGAQGAYISFYDEHRLFECPVNRKHSLEGRETQVICDEPDLKFMTEHHLFEASPEMLKLSDTERTAIKMLAAEVRKLSYERPLRRLEKEQLLPKNWPQTWKYEPKINQNELGDTDLIGLYLAPRHI
jgi:hypothetical protein